MTRPRPSLALFGLAVAVMAGCETLPTQPAEISALVPGALTPVPRAKPGLTEEELAQFAEEGVEVVVAPTPEPPSDEAEAIGDASDPDALPDPTLAAADLDLPEPTAGDRAASRLPLPEPGGIARSDAGGIVPVPEPDAIRNIYMAIQNEANRPTSVVFAMDENRNGDPSDDAAIRLTPENGRCNPQLMRRFTFPEAYARKPVFTIRDVEKGVSARQLPGFIATQVSQEMLRLGLAENPDDTRPQNLCSFELWRQQIIEFNVAAQRSP